MSLARARTWTAWSRDKRAPITRAPHPQNDKKVPIFLAFLLSRYRKLYHLVTANFYRLKSAGIVSVLKVLTGILNCFCTVNNVHYWISDVWGMQKIDYHFVLLKNSKLKSGNSTADLDWDKWSLSPFELIFSWANYPEARLVNLQLTVTV